MNDEDELELLKMQVGPEIAELQDKFFELLDNETPAPSLTAVISAALGIIANVVADCYGMEAAEKAAKGISIAIDMATNQQSTTVIFNSQNKSQMN